MLTQRIIPCLDCSNGVVVKGTNFKDLLSVGNPALLAKRYENQGADEIVLLDIDATRLNNDSCLKTVASVRSALSIPLTVGGGVRDIGDVSALLEAGADKVSINSAAVRTPMLVGQSSSRFGSQCTVVAIDARRIGNSWKVLIDGGSKLTDIDAIEWASTVADLGAGEILLTSFDKDGTGAGYDIPLIQSVRKACSLPLIASGGAATAWDVYRGFEAGADAALIASMLHFGSTTVNTLKSELGTFGIRVRI